jgi:hypothetical protein
MASTFDLNFAITAGEGVTRFALNSVPKKVNPLRNLIILVLEFCPREDKNR